MPRYLRQVGRAGDHDHRGVARELLARRVDGLALADAEALVHSAGLAHVARGEEHDRLGPLLLLVGRVGHGAEPEAV